MGESFHLDYRPEGAATSGLCFPLERTDGQGTGPQRGIQPLLLASLLAEKRGSSIHSPLPPASQLHLGPRLGEKQAGRLSVKQSGLEAGGGKQPDHPSGASGMGQV